MNFKDELISKYNEIKLFNCDVIYIYSDLRGFSQYMDQFSEKDNFLKTFIEPILERNITVIIPTFSYTTKGIFDTKKTKTSLGALNSWFINNSESERSEHPLFSYSSIGPKSSEIVNNIGKSAFGYDCIFERILKLNTKFLHIGRPLNSGNTMIHYIEQLCGATYRYNKKFNVDVYKNGKYIGNNYSAFLRIRNDKKNYYGFDFNRASKILESQNIVKKCQISSKLNNLEFYDAKKTFNILVKEFYKNNMIFLKGGTKEPILDL